MIEENIEFDCDYCSFKKAYKEEKKAHEEVKEHLVKKHSDEVRSGFPQFSGMLSINWKCQRHGCGARLNDNLVCERGHDNIRWWCGYLASMKYGLAKM